MPQNSGNGLAIRSISHADWKHIAIILQYRLLLKKIVLQGKIFFECQDLILDLWLSLTLLESWCNTSPSSPRAYNTDNRQKRYHSYSHSLSHRTQKCSKKHYWDKSKLKPSERSQKSWYFTCYQYILEIWKQHVNKTNIYRTSGTLLDPDLK